MPASSERILRRTSRLRPEVRRVERAGEWAVRKDWSHAPWPLRRYGRWCLRREWALLERLVATGVAPQPLERETDAIVVSYLEGRPLSRPGAASLPEDFFERLAARVAHMHRLGVVHLDLRQRRHILCGRDGQPCIVDFGAGASLDLRRPAARLALRAAAAVDRLALLKHKVRYTPERLTTRERRWARAARHAGYLWPPDWLRPLKLWLRRARR